MNAKISEFAFCVEAVIYLVLHNLHDCTFHCWNEYANELVNFFEKRLFSYAVM